MKLVVATGNAHKLSEIRAVLEAKGITVEGLTAYSGFESPEETGETFLENARIKAEAFHHHLKTHHANEFANTAVLADDSGLECEDLDGRPGVRSSRFAHDNATDAENNAHLMQELQKETHLSRAARFVCAMILILPDGSEHQITGTCEGHIVMTPKGKNGFGYDPHFYLEELDKTMAELSPEEKNKISHRAKALEGLREVFCA
ncbi:MAG: RdgB/HAM1 family non-canonical purine NTP pyrophosphatase [Deltaproteobacteria bacterium]|nr:RdgB/HAM1 family non-canonical purine NTP pyrophosphatase [Deltaproteobacteria bacterium]